MTFFGLPKVKWLQYTGRWATVQAVDVKLFLDLTHQKSLKLVNFWQSYLKKRRWTFLGHSVHEWESKRPSMAPSRGEEELCAPLSIKGIDAPEFPGSTRSRYAQTTWVGISQHMVTLSHVHQGA